MVYTYSAAVFVTRGITGPDRCRTTRGIKLIWVLCSVHWIPQKTQAPHPPELRERGSFTTDGTAVIYRNPDFLRKVRDFRFYGLILKRFDEKLPCYGVMLPI